MDQIELAEKKILITGAAGFIGGSLARRLVQDGEVSAVIGIDNMNDYYDPRIKQWRLDQIEQETDSSGTRWKFIYGDIADKDFVLNIFRNEQPDIVVNLAAQAGVRYSITNPDAYIRSNLIGFYNILEACRHSYDFSEGNLTEKDDVEKKSAKGSDRWRGAPEEEKQRGEKSDNGCRKKESLEKKSEEENWQNRREGYQGVQHLVYASSSSVYGTNQKVPFSTDDKVDDPVSLYAATKKSDELLAHAYSKLYNIPCTGLRFFTVYGPAGRPDMAYWGFTDKLCRGETIKIFNYGHCSRDFTYIDDVVEGIVRVMQGAPARRNGEDGLPVPPYALYNIGGGRPDNLLDFVTILQEELVRARVLPQDYDFEAHKELVPMQAGDVPVTYADTTALSRDFGYRPATDLRTGLRKFAEWYRGFYEISQRTEGNS